MRGSAAEVLGHAPGRGLASRARIITPREMPGDGVAQMRLYSELMLRRHKNNLPV